MDSGNAQSRQWAIWATLVLCLASGCASTSADPLDVLQKKLPRLIKALKSNGDADSLAAAAQCSSLPREAAERLRLLTSAVALAPARPDLLWLQLRACAQIDSCDLLPLAERLHELDPDNGAAWSPLLERAAAGDTESLDSYLAAIGKAKRFDIYWNTSIVHLTAAVVKTHKIGLDEAAVAILGLEATDAIPAFQRISANCRPPMLEEHSHKKVCGNIATALRHGDSYIAELMGDAVAQRVFPPDSPEYAEATNDRRVVRWQLNIQAELERAVDKPNTNEFLQVMSSYRTEQEVTLARLKAAGRDPIPPADWKDETPGAP